MRNDTMAGELQSILALCVNYHNEQDTQNFVYDLLRQEFTSLLRIIVVDNNEGGNLDLRLSTLAELDPHVRILHPKRNLGYFGAANWGLQKYLNNAPLPDWVIVSNTDISFPRSDFFKLLFSLYPNNAPAVIAPSIESTLSRVDQNPQIRQRPSEIKWRLYTWIFRYYPTFTLYYMMSLLKHILYGFLRKILRFASNREKISQLHPQVIYAPHGSFILFHRSYFDAGGNLEQDTFIFGESIIIAETIRRLNLNIIYDPRLSVLHHEHATTKIFKSRKIARYQWKASIYCFNKFFRKS